MEYVQHSIEVFVPRHSDALEAYRGMLKVPQQFYEGLILIILELHQETSERA